MNDIPLSFFIVIAKWILAPLILFSFVSATIYFFSEPTHQRNWSIEHSRLAEVLFDSSLKESQITLKMFETLIGFLIIKNSTKK